MLFWKKSNPKIQVSQDMCFPNFSHVFGVAFKIKIDQMFGYENWFFISTGNPKIKIHHFKSPCKTHHWYYYLCQLLT